MKTRVELYREMVNGILDILEDYDIYSREQILKSRNADCLEYRAVLVSALVSKSLTDLRIANILELSLQQVYRMKRLSIELSRDKNSVYSTLLPIIKNYVSSIE